MEIAATVTALAALITGLASFFMIMEMKKQRTATSKPVLKLLAKNGSATVSEADTAWSWESNDSTSDFAALTLMNFGTGPALNILASWDVDLDALVGVLKYFDPYQKFEFSHENGVVKLDNSFHATHNQNSVNIDAIPTNGASSRCVLRVPTYYISAFEKYVELGLINRPKDESDKPSSIELPDFPYIYISLEYEEINGTKLQQKYKVLLSFYAVTSISGEDKKKVLTTFNVEEIQER